MEALENFDERLELGIVASAQLVPWSVAEVCNVQMPPVCRRYGVQLGGVVAIACAAMAVGSGSVRWPRSVQITLRWPFGYGTLRS